MYCLLIYVYFIIKSDIKTGGLNMVFSKEFLWGTSISAAQAEGGWNEGGKAPVQVDLQM